MTADLIDFRTRKQARQSKGGLPARAPDLEVQIWLSSSPSDPAVEVEWVCTHHESEDWTPPRLTAAILDAAWMVGSDIPPGEPNTRPALMILVTQDGTQTLIHSRDLCESTTWRHGAWLVRRWWRITKRLLRIAWYAARARPVARPVARRTAPPGGA